MLLDLLLPDLPGIEVCRNLRAALGNGDGARYIETDPGIGYRSFTGDDG